MRQPGRAHKLADCANEAEILRLAPLRPRLEAVGVARALRDPLAQGGAKGVRLEVRPLQVAHEDLDLPAERARAADLGAEGFKLAALLRSRCIRCHGRDDRQGSGHHGIVSTATPPNVHGVARANDARGAATRDSRCAR